MMKMFPKTRVRGQRGRGAWKHAYPDKVFLLQSDFEGQKMQPYQNRIYFLHMDSTLLNKLVNLNSYLGRPGWIQTLEVLLALSLQAKLELGVNFEGFDYGDQIGTFEGYWGASSEITYRTLHRILGDRTIHGRGQLLSRCLYHESVFRTQLFASSPYYRRYLRRGG